MDKMNYVVLFSNENPERTKNICDKISNTFGSMNVDFIEGSFIGFTMQNMTEQHITYLNQSYLCFMCSDANYITLFNGVERLNEILSLSKYLDND